MKNLTKLNLSLALIATLSLVGCGGGNSSNKDTSAPVFTSSQSYSFNENEISSITLAAIDDISAVKYTIESGDAISFDINNTTGVVTFKVAPDFETKDSYSFTAIATDASENSITLDVVITIVDIIDTPDIQAPVFTSTSTPTSIENRVNAFTLIATDDRGLVIYSIKSGDADSFDLNESTGVVIFKTAPNFETKQSYSFIATATDGADNNTTQNVILSIIDENIVHNDTSYESIVSPYTNKIWLDRNLGASQVCTAFNDVACYGDYYQWGRNYDGHQAFDSAINVTQESNVSNEYILNDKFIIGNNDWITIGIDNDGAIRNANWSKTDGTSICPVGFRVPTTEELEAETISASSQVENRDDAYTNFLKFPSAGYRDENSGSLELQASKGFVWSSGVNSFLSEYLYFTVSTAGSDDYFYSTGCPVRCIKD
jgi:uncharacterized protein (TIGR02145 family)